MKRQKKKRRLKVGRLLFLLIFLFIIGFVIYYFINVPIKSIIINGNSILTDEEVIRISKLEDYPSYFSTLSLSVKNRLLKNDYISDVKVSKGLFNIKIDITENKVLYIDSKTKEKHTLTATIKDDKTLCVPYLTNSISQVKKKEFLKAMNKIDKDILCKMSEIKYDPNEIDEDRYFVYMNDGNSVYLTVNKFDKLNKYNTILENVGTKNGVIYLDYGDYFEVK